MHQSQHTMGTLYSVKDSNILHHHLYLFLCVSPVIDWQPVQGEPSLSPSVSWDEFQPPPFRDPLKDKWV